MSIVSGKSKIKICGLFRDQDIQAVNQYPPDYVGFILHFPKSHRNIHPEQLRAWKKILRPEIKTVGVFVSQNLETIQDIAPSLDVIQLHGGESEDFIQECKKTFPHHEIWKAFTVKTAEDVAIALKSSAHQVLLDYGKGEGKTFDWAILENTPRPYILAGGITLENLPKALEKLSPALVDLSSGAESDRQKDPQKIRDIIKIIRQEQTL